MAIAPIDITKASVIKTSITNVDILVIHGKEKRFIEPVSISMRTDIAEYIADLINEDLKSKSFW